MAAALPAIGGAVAGNLVGGLFGQGQAKASEKAANKAAKLTDLQAQQVQQLLPFLKQIQGGATSLINPIQQSALDTYQRSQQFDPGAESARAMQAYDTASKDITRRNLEGNAAQFASRGFTPGNAPSQGTAADQQILARAANDRGQYASQLKMNEFNRKEEVNNNASNEVGRAFGLLDPSGRTTAAANSLQGPVNSNLQLANYYGQQAASANPGALIPIFSDALSNVKWPWQKKNIGGITGQQAGNAVTALSMGPLMFGD
jgi:hypothetical protein